MTLCLSQLLVHQENPLTPDLFLDTEFYNGSIWFLLSLFWCNILYYAVNKLTGDKWLQICLVISLAAVGWICSESGLRNFLYIGSSLSGLPFFYFGRTLFDYKIIFNSKSKREDFIVLGVSVVLIGLIFLLQEETSHITFYLNRLDTGNHLQFYLCGFSLIAIALLLCKWMKRVPFVSFIGRFSIIVLVTHALLHNIINRVFQHLTGLGEESLLYNFLLFIIVVSSMSLVIPFCRKYLPYITAQKGIMENWKYLSGKKSIRESSSS